MIDAAIYSRLSGDSGVTAIASTRVYPVLLPQGATFPAITFERVSTGGRELHHTGHNQAAEPIFQVSCWATDAKTAKQLAGAVVKALHGWSGSLSGETIYRSAVINEIDLFDEGVDIYHVAVEVEILHKELLT